MSELPDTAPKGSAKCPACGSDAQQLNSIIRAPDLPTAWDCGSWENASDVPAAGFCQTDDCKRRCRIAALEKRSLPAELTDPVREALSMPNFRCGPIAWLFRKLGSPIPEKSEHEQAYVLHWALGLALEHGERWKQVASDQIQEMTTKAEELEGKPQ